MLRHNSLYKRDILMEQYGDLLFNRAFFTVLAILLVMFTAVIYEEKRRGRGIGIRVFPPSACAPPAVIITGKIITETSAA